MPESGDYLLRNLELAVSKIVLAVAPMFPDLGIKTVGHYERVLKEAVHDLYNGVIDDRTFIDNLLNLIDGQLTRAWNEGMRNNDLDPQRDMTPEWEEALENLKLNELDYVDDFADEIIRAAKAGDPIDPFLDRSTLWANRYNEVVNTSMITTRPEDRFAWRLGATEEHCATCATLNGVVATGQEWQESGYHPQEPPNGMLECGGWRCDCRFEYTEEPATEGGIPNA